jgi:putative heme iron utilization protein
MNSDHADALSLYATEFGKCDAGDWCMSGIDPAGMDLLHRSKTVRIEFPKRVLTSHEARLTLIELAKQARGRRSASAQP